MPKLWFKKHFQKVFLVILIFSSLQLLVSIASASWAINTSSELLGASSGSLLSFDYLVNSSDSSDVLVNLEVYDQLGNLVFQDFHDNQVFAAGETKNYSVNWQIPLSLTDGSYTAEIGVYGTGWNGLLAWKNPALNLTISSSNYRPLFTIVSSAAPQRIYSGDTVSINTAITSQSDIEAFVDIAVNNESGITIFENWYDNEAFTAGETKNYNLSWQTPTDTTAGTYTVSIGVFETGYGNLLAEIDETNQNAATITVDTRPSGAASSNGGGSAGGGGAGGGGGGGSGGEGGTSGGGEGRSADFNGDGRVNIIDLSIFLRMWGQAGGAADLNGSGRVDITDLSIFLRSWSR